MHAPLFCLTASLLLCPPALAQTDWFVDAGGSPPGSGTAQDPYTSIQFALAQPATAAGDQLLVATGTYSESIDFLGKDVTVRHDGVGALPIIVGDGEQSAVRFVSGETANARLVQFVVTGSVPTGPTSEPGGGVLVDGASPTLEEVIVRDSFAGRGGGIAILSGGLTMQDCSVLTNTATDGGGGVHLAQGSLLIEGGVIGSNFVDGDFGNGGGIEALPGTQLEMTACVVELNNISLLGDGGGIHALGTAALNTVTIRRNDLVVEIDCCNHDGGGIYAPNAVGTNCTIEENGTLYVSRGGGAFGGSWTDTVFRGNLAFGPGAGLSQGVATNCQIIQNATQGDGSSSGDGGGAADSTLIDCLVEDNASLGNGGGTANCVLQRCVVRGNRTFLKSGAGGGVYGGSAMDCLIENNRCLGASGEKGGGAAQADLLRCIVRGNSAQNGGGVYSGSADFCTIVHNLATGNLFGNGGGAASASIANSVVWGNAPDQMFMMGPVSYSNVQGGSPGLGNIDANPQFFGPGSDVHLRASSPCIDAADPAAPLDIDGSRADMGALPFELFHRREDGPFCFGVLDLDISGEVSVTGPPAVLTGSNAQLFGVGRMAGYEPKVFQASFGLQGSGLCLEGGVVRLLPTAEDELEITPALLARLGLVPGDRFVVQTQGIHYSSSIALSHGLDLLVRP